MSDQRMDLEQAVESKFAKTINRIVLPAMAAVAVTVITWLVQDLRSTVSKQSELSAKQTAEIRQIASDVQVINAKIDTGVLWRITELERRLNTVEAAQKTP